MACITSEMNELLERFERAVRAHELIGSLPPEEMDDVETEYSEAKQELSDALAWVP